MKILKYSINIIVSFLIIFAVIICILLNILNTKILNKDYILQKMSETEFNLQIAREVEAGFEKYIYQSGLPEDTIQNLFTEDMIEKDVNTLVNALYDGTEISLSSEEVKTNLDNKINQYIQSQNMNLNEQGKNNIIKFEDLIVNEYINNINVSNKLYENGYELISEVKNINNKIGNIPLIILVVLIVIMIIVNLKDLLLAINFLGISSLTIGILFKMSTSIIFSSVEIDDLVLITKSISNLIISILKENLYRISDYGNIFIICGITGILISVILRNINFTIGKNNKKPLRRCANSKE